MSLASAIVLIILLILFITILFVLMFNYYFLLKRLATKFPTYYKTLGMPFIPVANRSIIKAIKRDRYNYRLLGKLLRGIPAGFPSDTRARKLARSVQLELLLIAPLFAAGLVIALVFNSY